MSYDKFPSISEFIDSYAIDQSKTFQCRCKEKGKEETEPIKISPDSKLLNWEEWTKERERIQKKLARALNRGTSELLMTSFQHIRSQREEKMVLEYTKIPKPDIRRGCPGFFNLPESLKSRRNSTEGTYFFQKMKHEHCQIPDIQRGCQGVFNLPQSLKTRCNQNEGTYFLQKTKEEQCQIPEIEYVTVPYDIRDETHVPREICTGKAWIHSEYRQHIVRKKMKSGELQYVQPYKPEAEEIIIRGFGKDSMRNDDDIINMYNRTFCPTEIIDGAFSNEPSCKENVVALDVDNFELRPNDTSIRKLIIPFNYDIASNKILTKIIRLSNKGTIALRFQLENVKIIHIFSDIIPERKPSLNFNFNKSEDIILPGQKINFPISFITRKHGKYTEVWNLVTKPSAISSNSKFFIVLQAFSDFRNLSKKTESINKYLHIKVKQYQKVEDAESELKMENKEIKYPADPLFPKARVFEAVNTNFNPLERKPKYIYNQDAVRSLEEFYSKINKPENPQVWNLHISELQKMAKEKDIENYYEKHRGLKHLENQILQRHPSVEKRSLSKSKHSGSRSSSKSLRKHKSKSAEKKLKAKSSRIEQVSSQIHQPKNEPKKLTEELEGLLQKCIEPFVRQNPKQKKYQLAHKIFCVHFDKMCISIEILKDNLHINMSEKHYPTTALHGSTCSPRLTFNISNDYENYMPVYDRADLLAESAVQTICLENIAKENVEERFNLYRETVLGIHPEDGDAGKHSKKKGKGKQGKRKKSKEKLKSPKESEKKNKGKGKAKNKKTKDQEKTKEEFTCPPFDPHATVKLQDSSAIVSHEAKENAEPLQSLGEDKTNNLLSHYKYNLYTIIYNTLQNAVMEMTYMLDTFDKQSLTHQMIKKLDEGNKLKGISDIFDLKKAMEENRLEQITAECKRRSKSISNLQREPSENSIWSILDMHKNKSKMENIKIEVADSTRISYPVDNFEEPVTNTQPINVQTETAGGIVSETWQKGWPVGVQTENADFDFEEYIETFAWASSVQSLIETEETDGEGNESNDKFFVD